MQTFYAQFTVFSTQRSVLFFILIAILDAEWLVIYVRT